MNTKYGHFSADGSEYIITRHDTPRPWVNYLTNGDYCALCSHIGGGFSFYKDHRMNSVLRRGRHQYYEDMPARLIYIKDEDTGEVWTVNVQPFGKVDTFEARHGVGYTTIASSYQSIQAELNFFVPRGIDAELWELELQNTGDTPRRLSVYSFADMVLGNVSLDELEVPFMALFNEAILGEQDIIFLKKWWHPHYGWAEENGIWQHRAYFSTTVKPAKMLVNREIFFGAFRSYANPAALEPEVLPDALTAGKPLVVSCQWRITLAPGECWGTQMAIGVQPNEETAENARMIKDLQQPETYAAAWTRTRAFWDELFSAIEVHTPDADINTMLNTWNKYQAMINFFFGRGPSYYHKGQYPAMRDCCQDAFGVIALDATLAKQNIRRIARFFFADGRACGGCNRIGLTEGPSEKVDLPLWLILTVADYLRETGDYAFLDEAISLMDDGESTVYQKMLAGIDLMLEDRGAHGLPLIGHGDWNDAANMIGHEGKGESVWLGQFLYFVIHEIAPLMEMRGEGERLALYLQRAEELKQTINEHCWDGEWFVRAFRDDGRPVGTKTEKEGFIWINSQTWAAISGCSTPERLHRCLDSAEKHMGTAYGMMNLAPAFTEIDETIGLITRFMHGWKENAAVFSHASAFNVVARAKLGRGKDALDLYRRLLPISKDPDHYLVEPYVYSQFVVGPSFPEEFGRGAYHWLTGTAAWMLRALVDYILGVHPELDGLRITPAVDPSWTTFSLKRKFRGSTYEIEFSNPDGVETGVKELLLDGQPVNGNLLPLPTKPVHRVKVVMGKVAEVVAGVVNG